MLPYRHRSMSFTARSTAGHDASFFLFQRRGKPVGGSFASCYENPSGNSMVSRRISDWWRFDGVLDFFKGDFSYDEGNI